MARVRTQTIPWQAGGAVTGFIPPSTSINTVQGPLGVESQHFCDDTLGWPVPHALNIQHIDKSGLNRLNGFISTGGGGFRQWAGYVPTYFWNTPSGHQAITLPSTASDITKALALSNPSRPQVSIPNFVYELKDLPGMLRDIGLFKLKLKKFVQGDADPKVVAAYHLSFTFGWIPLISDLRKMAHFASETQKVLERIEKLHSGAGLRRRIQRGLGSASVASDKTVFIESAHGFVFTCNSSLFTTARRWATVRWKPTEVIRYPVGSKALANYAMRVAFGLNAQPVYLWNAIPWSWMVDWFTNVGDYLSTRSNVIPAISGPVCLMTETKTTAVFRRTDSITSVSGGDGTWIYHSKERTVGSSGTLLTELPFLDARKLSILAALAIQRRVPLS